MKTDKQSAFASRRALAGRKNHQGFTLVEIMVATTISLLVLAVALPTLVSGLSLALKSSSTNLATNGVRLATEHMAQHFGSASSFTLSPLDSTGHASTVSYTTSIGLPGSAAAAASTSSSIVVTLDGTCLPAVGDFVKIAGLDLGDGLRVSEVTDPRSATAAPFLTDSADVTLRFDNSLAAGTTGKTSDVIAGQSVTIDRVNSYQVVPDANRNNQLVWVNGTTSQVIAKGLVAASSNPFSMTPAGRLAFDFVSQNTVDAPTVVAGRQRLAYTRAGLHGQLMNKSQDPFQVIATTASSLAAAGGSSTVSSNPSTTTSTSTTTTETTSSAVTTPVVKTPATNTKTTTPAVTTTVVKTPVTTTKTTSSTTKAVEYSSADF